MGKYIKKTKGTGDVAVMEVSLGSLGVRTRARTLALQRDGGVALQRAAASYLQLRSRRLEKPPFLSSPALKRSTNQAKRAQQQQPKDSTKSNTLLSGREGAVNSVRSRSVSIEPRPSENEVSGAAVARTGLVEKPDAESETGMEASFGENMLDFDDRDSSRTVRETTPCSLMRNSESLEAPGSTTRPTNQSANNRRVREEAHRMVAIPTALEMEEFFADLEQQQQRRFTEKYNYDPVNDLPLPGRYEWIRLRP